MRERELKVKFYLSSAVSGTTFTHVSLVTDGTWHVCLLPPQCVCVCVCVYCIVCVWVCGECFKSSTADLCTLPCRDTRDISS